MAALSFDDVTAQAEKATANPLTFDDVAPQKPDLTKVGADATVVDKALALLEAPGSMAWSMGSQAVAGLKGAQTAVMSRVPGMGDYMADKLNDPKMKERWDQLRGMPVGDAFMQEYNKTAENAASMYHPLTPGGEQVSKFIGSVFTSALQFVGDNFFEHGVPLPLPGAGGLLRVGAGTPEAGALGQTIAAAAMFLTPGGKKGDKPVGTPDPILKAHEGIPSDLPPTPAQAWAGFAEKYPVAAAHIEASNMGKIRMSDFVAEDKDVFSAVGRNLDGILGLEGDARDMTLEGKLRQAMTKVAPDVPGPELDKAVRATLDGLRQADQLRVQRADSGLPLIPDPAISKEPVVVTKGGIAVTPEQAAAGDSAFIGMSMEERADALALSSIGRLRLDLEGWQRAQQGGSKGEVNAARAKLERNWARAFPWRDSTKRSDALDRFVNFGGRMTYDDAVSSMGEPTRNLSGAKPTPYVKPGKGQYVHPWEPTIQDLKGPGRYQGGMMSVEGLNSLHDYADQLKDGIVKSLSLVGSATRAGKHGDTDLLYNLGAHELPPDSELAARKVERMVESDDNIDLSRGDSFFQVGDRYFHLSSGAGRAIVENTEYGKAQSGKQTIPLGSAFKSQRGMIDIEGLTPPKDTGKKVERAAGVAASRPWTVGTHDQERPAFDKVQAAFDENRRAEESMFKTKLSDYMARAGDAIFGHDRGLKNALDHSGQYGVEARLRMVRQNAATDAARVEMDDVNSRIFNDLSKDDKQHVDELMRARRIIEIAGYRPDYKIPEGITGKDAEGWARELRRKLGERAYANIEARTNAIMAEYRKLLVDGLNSGVITKESFDRLIHFEYSPTEYIDLLDPIVQYNIHGKTVTVRGSGIADLGIGNNAVVRMNSQDLLAEAIARTRNRQFKNETLQSLYKLADTTPDNGIVKLAGEKDAKGMPVKITPPGYTKLGVRIGGEQREVLMKDEFAEQFVANPQPMLPYVANAARLLSGSALLRASAVGENPAFMVAGIPMDILHTWLASTRDYSPHAPVYFAQIGRDMVEVLPDLLKKEGSYKQAMREGLGAHYMASYGMHVFSRAQTISEKMMPRYGKIKHVLQGFNQEADIWIRLAHRNRLIKNGVPSEQATAMARDRLDYSQGGELTKGIDTIIPWTNVGMQALYKVAKASQRDPMDFAVKLGWVSAAIGSWTLSSMLMSPETTKAIPTGDKVRGLNITFGDQLYLIDPDGNKRYFYVPIRLDQVAAPVSAAIVGGLEYAQWGKMPSNLINETVSQSVNLLGGSDLVPTISALVAMSGYDPYKGKPIYQGPPVNPQDEVNWKTSPVAKMVGQMSGLSPMRLEAAAGKLVSQNNMWLQLGGAGMRQLLGDSDPRDKAKTSEQFLVEHLRPIVKLTNPLTSYLDGTQDKIMDANSHKKQQADTIDRLVYAAQHGDGSMKDVQAYVSTQPQEDRQRLIKHAESGYWVDQVMKKYEAGKQDHVPPRSWWKITAGAPAIARAQEFQSKWLDADAAGRKSMESIANRLQGHGTGYMSDDFKRELARERSRLGTDQR